MSDERTKAYAEKLGNDPEFHAEVERSAAEFYKRTAVELAERANAAEAERDALQAMRGKSQDILVDALARAALADELASALQMCHLISCDGWKSCPTCALLARHAATKAADG